MPAAVEAIYGAGRLAFGLSLITAPGAAGRLLLGDEAERDSVRVTLRTYGTRDTVIGLGAVRAVAAGDSARPWIAAGVASDVLDAILQAAEWGVLPPGKRVGGLLAAAGSAAVGLALLRD